MNIAFFPIFNSNEKLTQFIARTTWYLYPLKAYINTISFYTTNELFGDFQDLEDNGLLDSSIKQYIKDFGALVINRSNSTNDSEIDFYGCDYVFVADEHSRTRLLDLKKSKNLHFEVVRVDHDHVQYADSFYLRFAEKINGLHAAFEEISRAQIGRFLPALKTKKIYLFGTGPNFEFTRQHDFSDGLVIACNSMVINKEIIDRLSPKIFVIADPIFHAGPSGYAASFRMSLLDAIGDMSCPIVVPMRDYHIYSAYFPAEIVDRLIPLAFENPSGKALSPNLNLINKNSVITTSNILTLFQLPLAATLGDEIYVSGCDGRPLAHNNYFWSHNKSVQINDKMANIKAAHPAFFDISYDDYYSKHLETLELWLRSIEGKGKVVKNITPSYIPALQSRMCDKLIDEINAGSVCDLSIIVPLYNAEKFIVKCLQSITDSVELNFEILVIDDFSDDESLRVAQHISDGDFRVKVFQNFYKKGVSGARNTGIKLSRGSVICFLDADDMVFENSIASRYSLLTKSDENKIVHGSLRFIDEDDNDLGVEVGVKRKVTFDDCTGNPASFNTLMFRRDVVDYLWFDENLTNGEDWLAIAKILRLGFVSEYVREGFAAYRVHSGSTVIKDYLGHEERLRPVISWLHQRVPLTEACQAFAEPLKNSSVDKISANREISNLIMKIFSQEEFDVGDLVKKMGDMASQLCDEGVQFVPRFKVPFVRVFRRHINLAEFVGHDTKKNILNIIKLLDTALPGNRLGTELKKFLSIQEIDCMAKNGLKDANLLFVRGSYAEAKKAYEQLIEISPFYSFLDFNIKLCEDKLSVTVHTPSTIRTTGESSMS